MADIVVISEQSEPVQVNVSPVQLIKLSPPEPNIVNVSGLFQVVLTDVSDNVAFSFIGLTDTPSFYTNQAGKAVVVNDSNNGLKFVEFPTQLNADWGATSGVQEVLNKPFIPTSFTDLNDTPANYNDAQGKYLVVDNNTIVFAPAPSGGGGEGIALTDLSVTTPSPPASGGGSLTYSSVSGAFTFTPADVPTSLLDLTMVFLDGAIAGDIIIWDPNNGLTPKPPSSFDVTEFNGITSAGSGAVITQAERDKLEGIEDGAEVNVQSNWTETDNTSDAFIQNKPMLSAVATSGSYNDLDDTPPLKTDFISLDDTPANYTGSDGYYLKVDETGQQIVFALPPTGGGDGVLLTDFSAENNPTASGGGSLSYNNEGVYTFTPADVPTSINDFPEADLISAQTDDVIVWGSGSLTPKPQGSIDVNGFSGTDVITNGITQNTNDIASEAATRLANDNTLQGNIDAEATTRATADTTLQNNINAEASARISADATLQSNIDAETTARQNADTTLNAAINSNASDITTLKAYVLSEATDRVTVKEDDNNRIDISGIAGEEKIEFTVNTVKTVTIDETELNAAKVTIGGASQFSLPTSDGTSTQVLKTDGSGNVSFSDVSYTDITDKPTIPTLGVSKTVSAGAGEYSEGSQTYSSWSTGLTLTAGSVYYWNGSWVAADASAASSATGLIAVCSSTTDGTDMVKSGVVQSSTSLTGLTNGAPLYLSTTAGGVTATAPSASTEIVRVVGYVVDAANNLMEFSPSNDWIEIA